MIHTRLEPSARKPPWKALHAGDGRDACDPRRVPARGEFVDGLVVAGVRDPDVRARRRSCGRSERMPRSRFSREPPSATLPNSATAPVAASASERSVVVRSEASATGSVISCS